MTRRGKIVLAVLVVGSALGLVAATNAWFVAVSNTPPGAINSALVRWLPEAGERSFTSILTYGNLISGSGVDPDGVPLVLPGNPLIANVATDGATSTVRTSIARAFETGETADTVIHWEVKEYTRDDGSTVELIQKRRDVMDAQEPVDQWFNEAEPDKPIDNPNPNASDYTVTTTTSGGVGETSPDGKTTTTTTVVTTTYKALKANAPSYQHIVTTTKVVTHEAATITPAADAGYWNDATAVLTAQETVLWVRASATTENPNPPNLPTRSYLIITPHTAVGGTVIPLALGNLSNVDTNVRIGINGRLTATVNNVPTTTLLTLSVPDPEDPKSDGSYYLGTTAEDGTFIELIQFHPYTEENHYHWTKVAEDIGSPWSLWDLTVNGTTAVPAISTTEPAPSPSASPGSSTPPITTPAPTLYTVTDTLRIVPKRPDVNTAVDDAKFELLFNKLYCDKVPTITLHLSYYVRQSEFMDWTEFYSQDIDLSMPK